MTPAKLKAAVEEAKRFIRIAGQVPKTDDPYFSPSKETGAVKRASMDLTRVLAELRRP